MPPEAPLGLTGAQRGILKAQQLDPRNPAFNIAEYVEFCGDLDVGHFLCALLATIDETDAMRIRAVLHEDGPRQETLPAAAIPIEVIDLEDRSDCHPYAVAYMRADLAVARDPAEDILSRHIVFRLAPDRFLWYHRTHHFALDGYAFSLIAIRVSAHYRAAHVGDALPEPTSRTLSDVVAEDQSYLGSEQRLADRHYWAKLMANHTAAPTLSERRGLPSPTFRRIVTELSETEFVNLSTAARSARVMWSELLLAVVAAMIAQETGVRGIALGLPVSNRLGSCAVDVPCMVLGAIAVPVQVRPFDTVASLAQNIAMQLRRSHAHSRYRYEDLRAQTGAIGGDRRLFGPVVNIMAFDYDLKMPGVTSTAHNLTPGPVEDITIDIYRRSVGTGLTVCLDANPRRYESEELARISRLLTTMTTAAIAEPNSRTDDLTRTVVPVTPVQLDRMHPDVLDMITDLADADPTAPAVTYAADPDGVPRTITRSQLLEAARRITVAVQCSAPSAELIAFWPMGTEADIAVMLAAHQLDLPFAALDLGAPEPARELIALDHLDIALVHDPSMPPSVTEVAHRLTRVSYVEYTAAQVNSATQVNRHFALPRALPSGDAYITFTSGSTGTPKAVPVSRRNLTAFVTGVSERYRVTARDRVLQFAPLHADTSVEEIFVTLAAGASLVRPNRRDKQSLKCLLECAFQAAVTVLDLPTALWHELVVGLELRTLTLPPMVRTVIIGGEAASAIRVTQWHRAVGRSNNGPVRLINSYGPTEATVVATTTDLGPPRADEVSVSIGRPISTVGALLLVDDTDIALDSRDDTTSAKASTTGELCLYGPTVTSGYVSSRNLTAGPEAQFAFGTVTLDRGSEDERSVHVYRTGDLVTASHDGTLTFVGRIDDQVKISGYRVTPSAIDEVIGGLPGIAGSTTLIVDDGSVTTAVHSFVVASNHDITAADIHAQLGTALPSHARPRSIRVLDALPVTRNGKIDRAALLALVGSETLHFDTPSLEAVSDTEAAILAVWTEVTGAAGVALDSDFFLLGGHSMHTIAAANRLGAALDLEIRPELIFANPTARELAREIDCTRGASDTGARETTAMTDDLRRLCRWRLLATDRDRGREDTSSRHVFLTGATGFVGVHVLRELLARPITTVTVLMRGSSPSTSTEALKESITSKLGALTERESARVARHVRVIVGDLTLPRFGLSDEGWTALAEDVTEVINCAAVVSPLRRYSSVRAVNTIAVSELIGLCRKGVRASFHQISTVGVESARRVEDFLDSTAVSGYLASKAIAEEITRTASENGMRCSVIRLGRVLGSRRTGAVNPEDTLWNVLRACASVGCYPMVDIAEPLSSVDDVAAAIVDLALAPDPNAPDPNAPDLNTTVHTVGPLHTTPFADAVRAVGLHDPYRGVPLDHWLLMVEQSSAVDAQHKQLISAWGAAVTLSGASGAAVDRDAATLGSYRALPNLEPDVLRRIADRDPTFIRSC